MRIPWAFGPYMKSKTHVRYILELATKSIIFRKLSFPAKYNFVDDRFVIQSIIKSALITKAKNEDFLIGYDKNISLGDFVNEYLSLEYFNKPWIRFGRSIPAFFAFIRPFLPFKIQGLFWDILAIDNSKFKKIIGTVPNTSRRQNLFKLKYWIHNNIIIKTYPVTVITGTSSGLGLELVKKYLYLGHYVIGLDKNESSVKKKYFL